ncbi:MAG TPA: hypothetical protein VMU83_03915 [Hanamia sp.]|nr:hypothetical protein [Hanamia sp.]
MLVATTPKKVIREIKKEQLPITTLGITFPFQPSMHDKKFIQTTIDYITEAVATKLKEKYNGEFGKSILKRLDKTFTKLNYNTHKKSVVILIGPNEESVTYLDFFTKTLIYFNKNISLLDLVVNTNQQPEFFLLYSGDTKSIFFEFYNGKLHKEYETKESGFISNSPGYPGLVGKPTRTERCQQILNVLKLMNPKNKKPIFVTGNNIQANTLCDMSTFREIMFKKGNTLFSDDAEDKLNLLASEISDEWKYWHWEFLAGKLELAKKSNHVIREISAVSEALKYSRDGLLLIDKYYKKQLLKSLKMDHHFKSTGIWMNDLERFLSRGNHIEIVKTGLLKNYGGIVLIENETMNNWDRVLIKGNLKQTKNNFLLF